MTAANRRAPLRWRIVLFAAVVGAMFFLMMASNPDAPRGPTEREMLNLALLGGGLGAVFIGLPAMFLWRIFTSIFIAPASKDPPRT